jgi:hypothetical protein
MRDLARKIEVLQQFAEHAAIHHDRMWRMRRLQRSPRVFVKLVLPPAPPLGACSCRNCRARRGAISRQGHTRIAWALAVFLGGGR